MLSVKNTLNTLAGRTRHIVERLKPSKRILIMEEHVYNIINVNLVFAVKRVSALGLSWETTAIHILIVMLECSVRRALYGLSTPHAANLVHHISHARATLNVLHILIAGIQPKTKLRKKRGNACQCILSLTRLHGKQLTLRTSL